MRQCAIATAPHTAAYEHVSGVPANLISLDIWAPKCADGVRRAPVVVWVHGGSYQSGDKRDDVANKVRLFNARGWIFISVNYRLTRAGDPTSAHYPDPFRDVASAVAWTRPHVSAWGGDPHRLALLGHSAGADIVSNVITNPRWLQERGLPLSAVRCAGTFDTEGFDKTRATGAVTNQWQLAFGNDPNYRINTSATLLVRLGIGIPETITVVRGTALRQSIETAFADRLRAAKVPTTVINAQSLTHQQVNTRIGAPGDTVTTPPLIGFLNGCLQPS